MFLAYRHVQIPSRHLSTSLSLSLTGERTSLLPLLVLSSGNLTTTNPSFFLPLFVRSSLPSEGLKGGSRTEGKKKRKDGKLT